MPKKERVLIVAGKEMTVPEFLKSLPDQVFGTMGPDAEPFRTYCNAAAGIVEDLEADAAGAVHVEALGQAELARQQAASRRDQEIAKFFVEATTLIGTFSRIILNELKKRGEKD